MNRRRHVKAVIFDFDLTLIDSFDIFKKVRIDLDKKHNLKFQGISEEQAWGSSVAGNARLMVQNNPDTTLSWQEVEKLTIEYMTKHFADVEIIAQNFITSLRQNGKILGIVTGNNTGVIQNVLENGHNDRLEFDFVCHSDTEQTKEQLLFDCIEKYNVLKDEIIYVGDHANDIKAAKKAGILSAAVATGLQSKEFLAALKPDLIVDNLDELEKYLI
ncbi:MAG: HAD family hydrolase [Patescibacteria group bacterium]